MDDEWLVEQCLNGKGAYWNVLVRRYRPKLHEKVTKIFTDPQKAREFVEEVLFRARQSLGEFSSPSRYPFLPRGTPGRFSQWLTNQLAKTLLDKTSL